MSKKIIIVKDVVRGTSTNDEAIPLFLLLDNEIKNGYSVVLSLKDCTPMSSSFLNSSIGVIVENYGFDVLKGKLTISDYTPLMASTIKSYVNSLKELAQA